MKKFLIRIVSLVLVGLFFATSAFAETIVNNDRSRRDARYNEARQARQREAAEASISRETQTSPVNESKHPQKTAESVKPPEPVQSEEPAESVKPPEAAQRAQPAENVKPPEPAQREQPAESVKPPEPVQREQPVENVRQTESAKRTDEPKNNKEDVSLKKLLSQRVDKDKRLKELSKDIKTENDKIYNTTYYYPKTRVADPITVYPILSYSHDTGKVGVTMHSCYSDYTTYSRVLGVATTSGSMQWINYHTITMRIDDEVYTLKYDLHDAKHKVSSDPAFASGVYAAASSSLWESYTVAADENAMVVFKKIAGASKVQMRFSGNDYSVEKKMGNSLIKQIKALYEIYELLTV